jgi:hypothetical protein
LAALPARGRRSNRGGLGLGAQHDTCCTLCGGIAVYPVGSPGTSFYSTQTVPGLPLNASAWEVATVSPSKRALNRAPANAP